MTIDRPPYLFPLLSAGVAQLVEHHLAKVDVESSSLFARSIFVETPVALVVAGVFVFPIRWGGAVEVGERDADLGAETQAPGKAMALPTGVAVVGCGDVEPPAIPEARATRFGCGTAGG